MPARSIRWRPACCRSRSAKRPRPCPTWSRGEEYRFTVRFGAETDTDDAEGKVVASSETRPTSADDRGELPSSPARSSRCRRAIPRIKVDGDTRLRSCPRGRGFRACARRVSIDSLTLVDHPDRRPLPCSKPIAARAPMCARLPATWAARSAALGHVEQLRRTRVGPFGEERAVTLSALEALAEGGHEALLGAAPGRDGALRHSGTRHRGARCGGCAAASRAAQGTRCPHCRGYGLCHLPRHAGRRRRGEQGRTEAEAHFQLPR